LLLAKQIYTAINNKNATSVKILDVSQITTLTNIFIIAVANNIRQTQAISDEIEEVLMRDTIPLLQKEGYGTAKWILLDYGTVIVHVLYKEDAEFYALDRVWKDAKNITF
jgi:ribosome-associated protein